MKNGKASRLAVFAFAAVFVGDRISVMAGSRAD